MKRPTIDGIVLAAGESHRMGFPKPLLTIGDETFLARVIRAMRPSVREIVVVTGAHAERVRAAVPSDNRVRVIHNADFERGQLSSLKCALAAIDPDADAAMVHLADHPLVLPSTFEAVARGFANDRGAIVIARHRHRRGHPVLFARRVFDELAAAPEEEGARSVVNIDPTRVHYTDVDDPGVTLDLDTPEDLLRAGLNLPPTS